MGTVILIALALAGRPREGLDPAEIGTLQAIVGGLTDDDPAAHGGCDRTPACCPPNPKPK